MQLISVKNIKKIFRTEEVETPAIRGVSLEVEPGEFIAIMGASGSGKSTLLHILGLLDRQTSGSYRFEGKTIDDYSPDELAHLRNSRMGFVFQAFNLLPRTSVLENVKLPLTYSNVPSKEWDVRAKKAIDSVGLSHRIEHEPSQLSGGEKQRVAMARALVNNPSIIFADEPTGNLDSISGKKIMEVLQNLNDKGRHTIILITHETSTANYAKRIIRLQDGLVSSDRNVSKRLWAKDGYMK